MKLHDLAGKRRRKVVFHRCMRALKRYEATGDAAHLHKVVASVGRTLARQFVRDEARLRHNGEPSATTCAHGLAQERGPLDSDGLAGEISYYSDRWGLLRYCLLKARLELSKG